MTVLLVALVGGIGAATRFVVDGLIRGRWTHVFPLATALINVSGSAIIGLLSGAVAYHALSPTAYLIAAVGFCGGYTTFSTAMVETVRLIQSGDYRRAVVNALGSLLLALGAAALGVGVMRVIP
jgi:CrcB protein